MKKNLKFILKTIYFTFIGVIVLIIALTALSIFGTPNGAQIYVVETGSMEPAIQTGSIAFVSNQKSYNVGDIITYRSNLGNSGAKKNINVTHRITAITEDNGDIFYTTKGDNNEVEDPWMANSIDVIGKVNNHLPYIGYVVGFAKTKVGFVALILIPALIIMILEVINIAKIYAKSKEEYYKNLFSPKAKLHFDL